jgi:hypothetical protein
MRESLSQTQPDHVEEGWVLHEAERRVDVFLRSYRTAFEHLAVPQIAAHFAFPLHLTSDAGEVTLSTVPAPAAWLPQLERLVGAYRTVGVRSARPLETSALALSPRLVQARVRWQLFDAAGASLYEFVAGYTLAELEGDLRIVALAHDEAPRLRACLARRAPGSR